MKNPINKQNRFKTIAIASLLPILTAATLFIAGCGDDGKWNKPRDPNLPDSFYQTQQQLLEQAQASLQIAAPNSEQQFQALFEIGLRYQSLGKLRDAVTAYEKAFAVPGNEKVYPLLNNLAASYKDAGDYANAAKYVKKLYESNPDDGQAIIKTVEILLLNNEPEAAASALTNYVQVLREKKSGAASDAALISQLFQSIADYKSKHGQK